MINKFELVFLLRKYGINAGNLIDNNKNILKYGKYKNIEDILNFLISKNIKPENIEKCPSVLLKNTVSEIEKNYNFLTGKNIKVENCLHLLNYDIDEMNKVYNLIITRIGEQPLLAAPSILTGDSERMSGFIDALENTIGINFMQSNWACLLYGSDELLYDILKLPQIEYNNITKTYNKNILSPAIFKRNSSNEIRKILEMPHWNYEKYNVSFTQSIWNRNSKQVEEILNLPFWNDDKFSNIISPSMWLRTPNEIVEILSLSYWSNSKFDKLLTKNIWHKTKEQIEQILNLPYWNDNRFNNLLESNIWQKTPKQIKSILSLSYWNDDKFDKLLTPSLWYKTSKQIDEILSLSYWNDERYKHLLTPSIFGKDVSQIEEILNLPFWNNKKFDKLLTPVIWNKSSIQIEKTLNLPYWNDPNYCSLLSSTIWLIDDDKIKNVLLLLDNKKIINSLNPSIVSIKLENIIEIIEIFEKNNILDFIKPSIFRKDPREIEYKIQYMLDNNIPLIVDNKLNGIFNRSDANMKIKHNISINELFELYESKENLRGK